MEIEKLPPPPSPPRAIPDEEVKEEKFISTTRNERKKKKIILRPFISRERKRIFHKKNLRKAIRDSKRHKCSDTE